VDELSAEPITHEYRLSCDPDEAFAAYTERIGSWWDPAYTASADSLVGITIEPHVGGRVYATHRDLGDDVWGEVLVWEPGRRVTHSFTLAQDRAHPSEVTVAFERDGDGCVVRFSHGGWTPANADARAKFGDWPHLLGRFVDAHVERCGSGVSDRSRSAPGGARSEPRERSRRCRATTPLVTRIKNPGRQQERPGIARWGRSGLEPFDSHVGAKRCPLRRRE
jgi:hypothetical protein